MLSICVILCIVYGIDSYFFFSMPWNKVVQRFSNALIRFAAVQLFNKNVLKLLVRHSWKQHVHYKYLNVSEFGKAAVNFHTGGERFFFGPMQCQNCNCKLRPPLHYPYHIVSKFIHASIFEGGYQNTEKNTVFCKIGVELWAFAGTLVRTESQRYRNYRTLIVEQCN